MRKAMQSQANVEAFKAMQAAGGVKPTEGTILKPPGEQYREVTPAQIVAAHEQLGAGEISVEEHEKNLDYLVPKSEEVITGTPLSKEEIKQAMETENEAAISEQFRKTIDMYN